jgi:hypothetical protein
MLGFDERIEVAFSIQKSQNGDVRKGGQLFQYAQNHIWAISEIGQPCPNQCIGQARRMDG